MDSKSGLKIESLPLDDPAFAGMRAQAGGRNVDTTALRRRIGVNPVLTDRFSPGDDRLCEVYPCKLGDEFAFAVRLARRHGAFEEGEIWTRRTDQVGIAALALGLSETWCDWRSPPDFVPDRSWQVVRQDDNGNRFVLARFSDEGDAALYARLWDERVSAHKQTVFVVRGGPEAANLSC